MTEEIVRNICGDCADDRLLEFQKHLPKVLEVLEQVDFQNDKNELWVQKAFEQDDHVEHMWVGVLKRIGSDKFEGMLMNEPRHLTDIKYLDIITVKIEEVCNMILKINGEPFDWEIALRGN